MQLQGWDLVISYQHCVDSYVTRSKCNADNPYYLIDVTNQVHGYMLRVREWVYILYSGKLSKDETITNFSFRATCENFLHEIWACHTHLRYLLVFSAKWSLLTDLCKFSLLKVSRYMVG